MEITIQSEIKGIHHFKVWPHSDIPMSVEKEDGNRWDRHAMTVSYPELRDIPTFAMNRRKFLIKINMGSGFTKMLGKLLVGRRQTSVGCSENTLINKKSSELNDWL